MKLIMLLGSGELGKEFTISVQRLGHTVIAVDNYADAPAMTVSTYKDVIDMLDGDALRACIDIWKPDIIVPEIEAIRTEVLYDYESRGIQIVPSARAVNLTMNRDKIRDRAREIGLRTPRYDYAETQEEYYRLVDQFPNGFVVKPVMSSSGKGQTIVRELTKELIEQAWKTAISDMRGDRQKVIVEEFINFDIEITLLTVKQLDGPTIFCSPIGHYQERGDYQWSWQPLYNDHVPEWLINDCRAMARKITDDLGGAGLYGVEFFKAGDEIIFSELSPRPHDTGMVTLRSQNCSEFDLHARAILGLPIHRTDYFLARPGASAVILCKDEIKGPPEYSGIEDAMSVEGVDVRIFNKPETRLNRRMGVVLANDLDVAKAAASKISVSAKQ